MIARRRPLPCPHCGYDLRSNPWEEEGILCSECGVRSTWTEFAHLPAAKGRALALAWGSGAYGAICLLWLLAIRLPKFGGVFELAGGLAACMLMGPLFTWWLIGPPVMADWAAQRVAPPHRGGIYLLMLIGWGMNLVAGVLLVVALVVL